MPHPTRKLHWPCLPNMCLAVDQFRKLPVLACLRGNTTALFQPGHHHGQRGCTFSLSARFNFGLGTTLSWQASATNRRRRVADICDAETLRDLCWLGQVERWVLALREVLHGGECQSRVRLRGCLGEGKFIEGESWLRRICPDGSCRVRINRSVTDLVGNSCLQLSRERGAG